MTTTKTILCFGDSNTWGYVPGPLGNPQRYQPSQRWPGVLQASLGGRFHIIEEALNARTTVLDDPTKVGKNGLLYIRPCLDSHAPLDLVVLMLGTNDLKHRFGMSAADVAGNVAMLLAAIQQSGAGPGGAIPRILLMAPPRIGPLTGFADLFEGAEEKAQHLARYYRALAVQNRTDFVDAAEVVQVSPVDGVHLDAAGHARLGQHLTEIVRAILVRGEVIAG